MRRSRMFGWERNPLRRRLDRAEAALILGLIVVFLVTAPVLVGMAGHWTQTAGTPDQSARAAWQVRVTVQRGLPVGSDSSPPLAGTGWTLGRWVAPDGQLRTGWVPISARAAQGGSTRVWVTRRGSLTGAPRWPGQLQGRMTMVKALTAWALVFLLWPAIAAGRYLIGRRRLAAWDKAWRASGPRWTRQR